MHYANYTILYNTVRTMLTMLAMLLYSTVQYSTVLTIEPLAGGAAGGRLEREQVVEEADGVVADEVLQQAPQHGRVLHQLPRAVAQAVVLGLC
jgi:hypothetical protein